eukprot:COSAG01_NODE_32618_length_578_cov_1.083507_1_plen_187_part_01
MACGFGGWHMRWGWRTARHTRPRGCIGCGSSRALRTGCEHRARRLVSCVPPCLASRLVRGGWAAWSVRAKTHVFIPNKRRYLSEPCKLLEVPFGAQRLPTPQVTPLQVMRVSTPDQQQPRAGAAEQTHGLSLAPAERPAWLPDAIVSWFHLHLDASRQLDTGPGAEQAGNSCWEQAVHPVPPYHPGG